MSTLKEQLLKSNKDYKEEMVDLIIDDSEVEYSRKIEDLARDAKRVINKRKSLVLDMIPTNMLTKAVVNDKFDAHDMHEQELALEEERVKILKNLLANLKLYEEHFGPYNGIDRINALFGEGIDCHDIMNSILFG